ncbi:unnamed protein product [Orchesella dallaii]|uniref:Uncharacterized protein n=1 Tax=Orchesella dallaii TaxID=48710 RepID=A0ABP1RP19_9HEXA
MEIFSNIFFVCLILAFNIYCTYSRPTESPKHEEFPLIHAETSEVASSNHGSETEAKIAMTTPKATADVNLADITTIYPMEMTPTNLPATNIVRSTDKETAILSPDPKVNMDPITSSMGKEDELDVVDAKRSANTVRHWLMEKEQRYHVQLNSKGKVEKHATPTLPPWGDWTF